MSQGLRVWDSNGVKRVDTTYRLTRFVSSHFVALGSLQSTTIPVTGIVNNFSWVVFSLEPAFLITINSGSIFIQNIYPSPFTGYIEVFRV